MRGSWSVLASSQIETTVGPETDGPQVDWQIRADALNFGPGEEDLLTLFDHACRRVRLDIAAHLLRALEALSEQGSDHARSRDCGPLSDAYRTIASLSSARRALDLNHIHGIRAAKAGQFLVICATTRSL
jgi:hypothetical protein